MIRRHSLLALAITTCCHVFLNNNKNSLSFVECNQISLDEKNEISSTPPRQLKLTLPKLLLESSIRNDEDEYQLDTAMQIMSYDVGDGLQETYVYVEPTIEQMYHNYMIQPPPSLTKVEPRFRGFGGRFVNMSNRTLSLYWWYVYFNAFFYELCRSCVHVFICLFSLLFFLMKNLFLLFQILLFFLFCLRNKIMRHLYHPTKLLMQKQE